MTVTEDLTRYPKEVQEVIKSVKVMNREELVKYFDDLITYYENKINEPYCSYAKDYVRSYREKKEEVLKEYDEKGIACYCVDYNHYGHGFDSEDIDVYLYTDGTYHVSCHYYSAY